MRRVFIASAVLMLIPGVAWAGFRGVDTSGCAGFNEGTEVSMLDSCFDGVAHFAAEGDLVTVSNDGSLPHTFTAVDGSFDTGLVDPGSSAEVTIDEPGVYRVFCSLHGTVEGEGMAGVLVVGDAVPASAVAVAAAEPSGTSPSVVTMPATNIDPMQLVVLLVVGFGAGLAFAALLMVMRLRVVDGPVGRVERMKAPAE